MIRSNGTYFMYSSFKVEEIIHTGTGMLRCAILLGPLTILFIFLGQEGREEKSHRRLNREWGRRASFAAVEPYVARKHPPELNLEGSSSRCGDNNLFARLQRSSYCITGILQLL